MIKARIRWCSCRVKNNITLGKLLRLWFCFLLHSILFFISQTFYLTYKIISSYEFARPIMGTIFLVVLSSLLWVWPYLTTPNSWPNQLKSACYGPCSDCGECAKLSGPHLDKCTCNCLFHI